jgi:hypothetical protein
MTAKSLVFITALSSLMVAQQASAQPRWGRERMPNQGACFYEDTNFRGKYFCLRAGDRLTAVPEGMGDKISSVRMRGNTEVTVYRDQDMRGRSARLINDVRDLKREGWNDQISSVDVGDGRDYSSWGGYGERGRARERNRDNRDNPGLWRSDRAPVWGRNEQTPQEGACFYEDTDFRGQYFCAPRGATYTSLPRGFNDRISSVRVFGGEVVIFPNSNFRGRSQVIRSDVRDLRGNWGDSVSSLRVF